MRTSIKLFAVATLFVASAASGQTKAASTKAAGKPDHPAAAQSKKPKYKRSLADSLKKQATITEAAAATTALAQVPNGKISSVELERSNGKLVYSYDIKTTGKSGVDEVQIDAMTGSMVSNIHETPKMEKAEKAEDAKEKKAEKTTTKKSTTTKKPPV